MWIWLNGIWIVSAEVDTLTVFLVVKYNIHVALVKVSAYAVYWYVQQEVRNVTQYSYTIVVCILLPGDTDKLSRQVIGVSYQCIKFLLYYLFGKGDYVFSSLALPFFLSVCLSVCLLVTLHKTLQMDCDEILWRGSEVVKGISD